MAHNAGSGAEGLHPQWWIPVARLYNIDVTRWLSYCRGPLCADRAPLLQPMDAAGYVRPWSVPGQLCDGIPGLGTRGVAFSQAKAQSRQNWWRHETLLIDAINELCFLDGERISADHRALEKILAAHGVRRLAVVSHGDGSHLKLGSIVVCGLYSETETDLSSGEVLKAGCRRGVTCKRAVRQESVLYATDLKAREVVLLTCKAGSLVDAAFPATSNVVLGLMDGYAATVIAPDGNSVAPRVVTEGLATILTAGLPCIRDFLDDVSGRTLTRFFLFGSPHRGDLAWNHPAAAGRVAVRRIESGGAEPRIAVRRSSEVDIHPGRDALLQGRYLIIPRAVRADAVTIEPNWRPDQRAVAGSRMDLARMFLAYHPVSRALRASSDPRAAEVEAALARARAQCESEVYREFERCTAAADHGMGTPCVSASGASTSSEPAMAAWGGAGGAALYVTVANSDPTKVLASSMWRSLTGQASSDCEVCHAPMAAFRLDELMSGAGYDCLECRHCGPRLMQPIDPGGPQLRFSVESAGTGDPVLLASADEGFDAWPAWLVWKLAVRGAPGEQPRWFGSLRQSCRVPVTPPARFTDQLHTLRVVATAGTRLWVWQARLRLR